MAKRKAEGGVPSGEESDQLTIRPLGAGQEVGRSCIMLEFKNKKIMLDCGIHPGLSGLNALPYTDMIDAEEIDLLLITHFHLDHCGGLPWFLEKTTFKGRVFMTHATKAIYRWLLSDYIKVSNISTDQMLYTEKDLEKSMEKIETVNFHQEVDVNGIRFWSYNAGHVLGAAMFMLEIAGVKILYTGDFSCEEDRHLMAAEVPSISPDVLISEATFGTHIHEPREAREARFTGTVHDIVNRGGRCLIPVFALGRAQELLLILDEYWASHPELHDVPIYYASSLAQKCMAVYQTFIGAMNEKIRRQFAVSNPFVFKHISNLKNIDQFDDIGPCVIMASPGMMQSGLSRQLFEAWCTDKRNGLIVAGYCVEGTLAKHVLTEPSEVVTSTGQKLPLRMSVDYISFAAHTDYQGTSNFIKEVKPPHIVLVHGEANEMGRLKAAVMREYEDSEDISLDIYTPHNTQAVELNFRGEKMAKVMGSLATKPAVEDLKLSGVLVKRGFNYHLIHPSDLSNYTELSSSSLCQRQVIQLDAPFSVLFNFLKKLSPDAAQYVVHGKTIIKLFEGALKVIKEDSYVILEWSSDSVNDTYADAVLDVVLKLDAKATHYAVENRDSSKKREGKFPDRLHRLMRDMFGVQNVKWCQEEKTHIEISVDSGSAVLDTQSLAVETKDDGLHHLVSAAARRLYNSLTATPI